MAGEGVGRTGKLRGVLLHVVYAEGEIRHGQITGGCCGDSTVAGGGEGCELRDVGAGGGE